MDIDIERKFLCYAKLGEEERAADSEGERMKEKQRER